MDTTSGTVTVWQSGRLAPRRATRRVEFGHRHWLMSGLLALSALVLAEFVAVLERDVDSSAMQHAALRSRAVAQAECEAGQPARLRGRCVAPRAGDVVVVVQAQARTADHTPDNTADSTGVERENAARATTLSLLAAR